MLNCILLRQITKFFVWTSFKHWCYTVCPRMELIIPINIFTFNFSKQSCFIISYACYKIITYKYQVFLFSDCHSGWNAGSIHRKMCIQVIHSFETHQVWSENICRSDSKIFCTINMEVKPTPLLMSFVDWLNQSVEHAEMLQQTAGSRA